MLNNMGNVRVKAQGNQFAFGVYTDDGGTEKQPYGLFNEQDIQDLAGRLNHIAPKTYNGWTNYETWAVKLWLDNDEGSQELQRELLDQAKDTPKVSVWTIEETVKFTLADLLKDTVDEMRGELYPGASMFTDLLGAALSEVNWNEIAESIIND